MDRVTSWIARIVLVFLYIPIVAVIVYSFNSAEGGYQWKGFTLEWYGQLFGDTALLQTLLVSVIVGVLAASVATVIGLLAAIGMVRFPFRGSAAVLGAIALPLIVPEIVLGVALLSVFSFAHIPLGILTLVLGHMIITLPLTTLILIGAFRTLDPSLIEAAADLGCTPWRTFTRVLFPLMRSSILASWLLAFTVSLGNIVISTFVSGVGSTTMPLRVYSLLKSGLTPELNALGTLLIVLTFVVVLSVGIQQMRRILASPSGAAAAAPPDTSTTSIPTNR
ncbi:ABC transporter permease [Leifsonia sp. 21MFCrub1.1]|uniref:ABC transporter permease n=1 Tax=Leifsonia sp. 21MFCrub1.1 TaxID=1798223 RepID=UPI0008929288|nr:ABC transporter permease [Leifsonia sp. 21MFCrub1.1]SEB07822.1 spermidine/putrescine transport system permease protein [Leifsonia sp. 21MFCrub1.1]